MPVTVAIVEDNEEICAMLARVITRESKLNCVGTCSSGEMALEILPKNPPQVVIMDIQLPGMSGIECTSRLRQLLPETQVLIYTVYGDNEQVFKALKAGASGYLLKKTPPAKLLEALQELHQGGSPMSGSIARQVVAVFQTPAKQNDSFDQLSAREQEILTLLNQGFLYKEVADRLGIAIGTVRTHISRIYDKLHVRSRAEAMIKVSTRSSG